MKKEFEKHCSEYNLNYDFKELGHDYADSNTHQAYVLFKSLNKNTIHSREYKQCCSITKELNSDHGLGYTNCLICFKRLS